MNLDDVRCGAMRDALLTQSADFIAGALEIYEKADRRGRESIREFYEEGGPAAILEAKRTAAARAKLN